MAIRFKCPKCGAELNVKDELAGKQGRCPACKNAVTVPSLTARRPVAEPELVEDVVEAEVIEEDDEPVRGRSARRGREDEDDRPRKKGRDRDDDDVDDDRHGHHEVKELTGRGCLWAGGIEDRLPVVASAGNRDA